MNKILRYIFNIEENKKLRQSKFSAFSYDVSSAKKKKLIEAVIRDSNRDQRAVMEKARQIRAMN